MFPIRDENPNYLTPYATYTIVALNILAWIFVQGLGSEPIHSQSLCQLGLLPGKLLQIVPAGITFQVGPNTICQTSSTVSLVSLVTHMFLHGSWMHIIANLWFLWIFGNNVEDSMGHLRFMFFYLLCGLASASLQILSNPASIVPMIGLRLK